MVVFALAGTGAIIFDAKDMHGVGSQARPAGVYGAGIDADITSTCFRVPSIVDYSSPTYDLPVLAGMDRITHRFEPSVGFGSTSAYYNGMRIKNGVRATRELDHKEREKQDTTGTPLEYYIHDEADALRLEIVGNLTGPAVASVDQTWRTARSVLDGRRIVVGLTAVAEADESGRDLLLGWHRRGARIIARSPESRKLAEHIVGAPVPMPAPKSAWRQRVNDLLLRRSTAAMKLA